MKIVIVTSHFTPTLADPSRITNGLDAIVVKAIPILKERGHDVHVFCAGKVDRSHWELVCTPHSLVEDTVESLEGKSARMALTRSYYKKVKSELLRLNPDFVWSHVPSPGTSAEWALDFPTVHHVHEVNQNAMYAIGRIAGLAKVIENGGCVYNSLFAEREQRAIARSFIERTNDEKNRHLLDKPIVSVYQFVNAPMDSRFLKATVEKSNGLPFMMGRYDPKFTGKNVHLVDKLGIPMVACVSGNHPKIWDQLRESETSEVNFNLSRGQTIDVMRRAGCHIMAYLYESVPVFNYEMMCLGSLPVSIGLSDEVPNAAYTYASKIHGDVVPKSIPIKSSDLKERIEHETNRLVSMSHEERVSIAEKTRNVLSHENWYRELISCIPTGKKTNDVNALDF